MNINKIVKVNIVNTIPERDSSFLNREAVACVIFQSVAPNINDTSWINGEDAAGNSADNKPIADEIKKWLSTFTGHDGSFSQVKFKRLYVQEAVTDVAASKLLKDAVKGSDDHDKLDNRVIQIQVIPVGEATVNLFNQGATWVKLAGELDDEGFERKLVYGVVKDVPNDLEEASNLVLFKTAYEDEERVYESAAAMAYLAAFDFSSGKRIDDLEYTRWTHGNLTGINDFEYLNYNAFVRLNLNSSFNYIALLGGVTVARTRILTEYFLIVIEQLITEALLKLVVSKLRFSESLYVAVYSEVARVLDLFTKSELLDGEFISPVSRTITRGGINYSLIKAGERLNYGYKLLTLPITEQDYNTKEYTGAYLYIAIGNQLRSINLTGLVIGGN